MILEQVLFLADYYTDLVSSFRFVVVNENLVSFTSDRLSFSLKSRCARDSD